MAHVLRQLGQLSSHLFGVRMAPLPMAGKDPGKPRHAGQAPHRLGEGLPRVPGSRPEHVKSSSLCTPGQRVAGEEVAPVVFEDHAAAGVAGDRNGPHAGSHGHHLVTAQDVRGIGSGIGVGLVDPDPGTEPGGIAVGVGHVIAMAEQARGPPRRARRCGQPACRCSGASRPADFPPLARPDSYGRRRTTGRCSRTGTRPR